MYSLVNQKYKREGVFIHFIQLFEGNKTTFLGTEYFDNYKDNYNCLFTIHIHFISFKDELYHPISRKIKE